MNKVATGVTYRVEERSTSTGEALGTWGRHTTDRAAALAMFTALLVGHELFHPHGPRRLVLLASPTHSAPLNPDAAAGMAVLVDAGEVVLREEIRAEFETSVGAR